MCFVREEKVRAVRSRLVVALELLIDGAGRIASSIISSSWSHMGCSHDVFLADRNDQHGGLYSGTLVYFSAATTAAF